MWKVYVFLVICQAQVVIKRDSSLNIAVVCPDATCGGAPIPNYNAITPTLSAGNPIYIPYNALGLVSKSPLIITDYFTGEWTITNGTNGFDGIDGIDGTNGTDGLNGVNGRDGLNGKNGIDGLNGKDCNETLTWILLFWCIVSSIWILILTIYICKLKQRVANDKIMSDLKIK